MTPAYRILSGVMDATNDIHDRFVSLSLADEEGWESDRLEIVLDNRPPRISLPSMGEKISLALGYKETGLAAMGSFALDEMYLQHPPATLTLRSKGVDFAGADLKSRRTRSLDDVLVGDLIAQIASSQGLDPKVSPSLARFRLVHIDQTEESDLHLLTRLGKDLGALVVKATGRHLLFLSSIPSDALSIRLSETDCTSWSLGLRERPAYGSVVAQWHDTEAALRKSEVAGKGEPVFRMRHTYQDAARARTAAHAKLADLSRDKSSLTLTTTGRPEIHAGARLRVQGVAERVDGIWEVSRVEHTLNAEGYRTHTEASPPDAGN